MKKFIYLFILAIASTIFFSCNEEDKDEVEWRDKNIEAYDKITVDPTFSRLTPSTGGPTGVYRRVIEKGNGIEYPYQSAKVKVNYKGSFYEGTVFDAGTSVTGVPATFRVDGVIRGFSTALQHMVVGDKWEVVIPYELGYGAYGLRDDYGNILINGYSTLFFEVELLEIDQNPK